jgi:hypothetical protein
VEDVLLAHLDMAVAGDGPGKAQGHHDVEIQVPQQTTRFSPTRVEGEDVGLTRDLDLAGIATGDVLGAECLAGTREPRIIPDGTLEKDLRHNRRNVA